MRDDCCHGKESKGHAIWSGYARCIIPETMDDNVTEHFFELLVKVIPRHSQSGAE